MAEHSARIMSTNIYLISSTQSPKATIRGIQSQFRANWFHDRVTGGNGRQRGKTMNSWHDPGPTGPREGSCKNGVSTHQAFLLLLLLLSRDSRN